MRAQQLISYVGQGKRATGLAPVELAGTFRVVRPASKAGQLLVSDVPLGDGAGTRPAYLHRYLLPAKAAGQQNPAGR